ncbi:hypothetical protein [Candidatus Uabimicrobium amorphum]|uniref:Uncharacterized protein n=1 Tax=Uabimicrobium amorphum TaxID=2596890 RepID=A0A5S9F6Q6_UABAM|nr:hypothetical protein [Candidatus Uabimicrobium amorphum]BBM88147.1 hypothetical protein UABAM_06563 [Candidatus Uabimicrobium amorphum]
MRLVFISIFLILSSCGTVSNEQKPSGKNTNEPRQLDTLSEKQVQKKPVKKDSAYIVEERLPSQFYISGNPKVIPGEKYTIDLSTREKDTVQTIVYHVKTPLVFTDEITSVENPIISDAILATLSDALVKKNRADLISYQKDRQIQTIGNCEVVDIKETYIIDTSPGWDKRQIVLESITKPGMYLLEVRIGPQAAFIVVTANAMTSVVEKYGNRTLVWLTNSSGKGIAGLPLFYEDQDGNSLQKLTNDKGVAVIDCYSPWILAWKKSQVAVFTNPQRQHDERRLWLDKKIYARGETIHVAWKHALPSQATAKLLSATGKEVIRQNISPQPNIQIVVPQELSPGEYKVQIENISQKIIIIDHKSDLEQPTQITTDRYAYKSGDIVTLNIYGVKKREVQIDIYQHNTLVDRQIQISNNGMATCYLQLQKQGNYKIQSCGATAEIFVDNETLTAKKAFPERKTFNKNYAKILLPKNDKSVLYVLQGSENIYHVQPPQELGIWKEFAIEESGHWQGTVFSNGTKQNTFEFHVNGSFRLSIPAEMHTQQKYQVGIDFAQKNDKYLLWATNGSYVYQKPQPNDKIQSSDARNLPYLYKKWVHDKVKADYALAIVDASKNRHASAVYLCQQILKWIPQHKPAQSLLQKSIRSMTISSNKEYLSPKERLKYTYVGGLSPKMTFQQLVSKIEEQANVYIEVDPKVYEKYPAQTFTIAGLPNGENAFSLLSYFFTTRSLTYKEEHGTLFITLNSENILLDLLDKLDKRIDTQLENLKSESPKVNSDKRLLKTAFWSNWKPGTQQSTISFPTPGMWTIHGVIVDKNNKHYSFVQQVWVADKLP